MSRDRAVAFVRRTFAAAIPRAVPRALFAAALVAVATDCTSLLTDPARYGVVDVLAHRRNGAAIPGVGLELYAGNRPMGYAVTDSAGAHRFTLVPEGFYGVRAVLPDGYSLVERLVAAPPSDFVQGLHVTRAPLSPVAFTFLKQGPGTLSVAVRESDGTPVAGVTTYLFAPSGTKGGGITDTGGQVTFNAVPFGVYGIRVSRPDLYRSDTEPLFAVQDGFLVDEGSRDSATFRFSRCSGSVQLEVVDEGARPVAGFPVTLYNSTGTVTDTVTASSGSYTFSPLACREFGVRLRPLIGWTITEGRGSSFADGLRVSKTVSPTVTLQVHAVTCRGTIRALVQDAPGAAIPGAVITLFTVVSDYRTGTSGADGRVTFEQIPCGQEFGVRIAPPPGYSVTAGRGSSYFDGIVIANGATTDLTFRLTRP